MFYILSNKVEKMRTRTFIVLSIMLAVAVVLSGCGKKTPQDKLAEAQQSFQKGDTLAAIIMLEEIIEKNPDDPVADEAHMMLAQVHFMSDDVETALQHLDSVLERNGLNSPIGMMAFRNKLVVLARKEQFSEGVDFIQETIDDLGTTTGSLYLHLKFSLADFYSMDEQNQKATDVYKDIVKITDNESALLSAIEGMVAMYEQEENYSEAIRVYRDYLESNPDTAVKNMLIGGIAYYEKKLGNDEKAAGLFAQAVEGYMQAIDESVSSREKMTSMIQLAKLYSLMDEQEQAIDTYESALEQFPNSEQVPAVLMDMANMYREQKQYDKAVSILNRILKQYPKTQIARSAWRMMGQITQERQTSPEDSATSPTTVEHPETGTQ